jgi:hypothetical protein
LFFISRSPFLRFDGFFTGVRRTVARVLSNLPDPEEKSQLEFSASVAVVSVVAFGCAYRLVVSLCR